jgi:hypothetical protein
MQCIEEGCGCTAVHDFEHCFEHSPICAICHEKLVLQDTQITYCDHEFHHDCLEEWLTKNNSCPLCRKLIKHNIILDESLKVTDVNSDFAKQLVILMSNIPSEPPMNVRIKMNENKKLLIEEDS